jgi:hypothetical protein
VLCLLRKQDILCCFYTPYSYFSTNLVFTRHKYMTNATEDVCVNSQIDTHTYTYTGAAMETQIGTVNTSPILSKTQTHVMVFSESLPQLSTPYYGRPESLQSMYERPQYAHVRQISGTERPATSRKLGSNSSESHCVSNCIQCLASVATGSVRCVAMTMKGCAVCWCDICGSFRN